MMSKVDIISKNLANFNVNDVHFGHHFLHFYIYDVHFGHLFINL